MHSGSDLPSRDSSEKDIETLGGTQQDGPRALLFKAAERRVVRKIDMNLMPLVMVLCEYASFNVELS